MKAKLFAPLESGLVNTAAWWCKEWTAILRNATINPEVWVLEKMSQRADRILKLCERETYWIDRDTFPWQVQ